jgi:ubiquinone/menaquinone biosynthesis C-methylase UbiE
LSRKIENKKMPHVFDHKHAAGLDSEARKTWQNPEEIIEQISLEPSYIVADLGCGTGYLTVPVSRRVKKVYGIDIQKEMLAILDQKIQTQKIGNIETLLSNDKEIPLQNASIDLLVSVNVLHEFRDKDAIIREIKRVLKADGHAAIIDFKKEDTGFGPPVGIRLSEEQAKQLFKKNGLTALKTYRLRYHYLIVFENTGS